ncbi:MAG: tripartite tricarboxylate transporter permease [Christensenellales bacterium]
MGVQLTVADLLQLETLIYLILSVLAGIIIGALPGLTATMGVSLLVSTTVGLGSANAIVVMCGVFLGGIYGGSRSAILLNVPGTPSSAATALDGFPLAKKGEGIKAGIVATTFSALGGLVGCAFLLIFAPQISKVALKIGYWEYFWLGMFGVVIAGGMQADKPYKGLLSGILGLVVACIGIDGIYGVHRFTFGTRTLKAGISLVPAMIGLFGLSEVFTSLSDPESHMIREKDKTGLRTLWGVVKESFVMLKKHLRLFIQSSVIGTFIGAVPGTGEDIASWVSYDTARHTSKEKELFGKGSWEGLIASETANNACTGGVFIPMLTLGVAGDAVSAIIMGAMQLHGYRTGPNFMVENPGFFLFLAITLVLINIVMFFQGVVMTPIIGKVLQIRMGIIMPIVTVLCVIGSYAVNTRTFDISVMVVFGFLGFLFKKLRIPTAPMALGIILGELVELNLRRGLMAGEYSIAPFFTRPVAAVFFVLFLTFIILPIVRNARSKKNK